MPAALYPRRRTITSVTRHATISNPTEVAEPLLCLGCEKRLNEHGESEVLRWLAPKVRSQRSFPLLTAVQAAPTYAWSSDVRVASGAALGIPSEAFAYFAISIVWRASVHKWLLPDGTTTSGLELGDFAEGVRRYLLGIAPLPESYVTVAVCTDRFSREHWVAPMLSLDYGCQSFPFITLGVVFRVWFGARTPEHIRRVSCRSEPDHPILVTHCDDQTARILDALSPLPDIDPTGDA